MESEKTKFSNLPPGSKQIMCSFLNLRDTVDKFCLLDKKTNKIIHNSVIASEGKHMVIPFKEEDQDK